MSPSEANGSDGAGERTERARPAYGPGAVWEGDDPLERRRALEAAFDYRGDVTLRLSDGSELVGYIANRDAREPDPFVEIFPRDGGARRAVSYSAIQGIAFSTKDPASGKSWEAWVKRWKAKKEAEARGEKIGDVSLYPEKLE